MSKGESKEILIICIHPLSPRKTKKGKGARMRNVFILRRLVVLVRKPCGSSQQLKTKGVGYHDEGTPRGI
jgi:hypothetical protein